MNYESYTRSPNDRGSRKIVQYTHAIENNKTIITKQRRPSTVNIKLLADHSKTVRPHLRAQSHTVVLIRCPSGDLGDRRWHERCCPTTNGLHAGERESVCSARVQPDRSQPSPKRSRSTSCRRKRLRDNRLQSFASTGHDREHPFLGHVPYCDCRGLGQRYKYNNATTGHRRRRGGRRDRRAFTVPFGSLFVPSSSVRIIRTVRSTSVARINNSLVLQLRAADRWAHRLTDAQTRNVYCITYVLPLTIVNGPSAEHTVTVGVVVLHVLVGIGVVHSSMDI